MRDPARESFYLVRTPKGKIQQYEKKWLDLPWQQVRESVDVKLFEQDSELYVPRAKEEEPKKPPCAASVWPACSKKLRAMRRLPSLVQLPMRLGAAKSQAGRAFQFVQMQVPEEGQQVTRETFQFRVDKQRLQEAEWRDGHYFLRSDLTVGDPSLLWTRYVQLTQIESVFRSLKSELGIRPIYHQLEHRADAHILIAFLAYCLQVTLKHRLLLHAPGLTPTAVLEKLAEIKMIDVWIPTVDQRRLMLPR
jgi:Transposase DDE domain